MSQGGFKRDLVSVSEELSSSWRTRICIRPLTAAVGLELGYSQYRNSDGQVGLYSSVDGWTQPRTWHLMSQAVSCSAGRATAPRLDSTVLVIAFTLFSLSVTVYQISVTEKYSPLSPQDEAGRGAVKIRSRSEK